MTVPCLEPSVPQILALYHASYNLKPAIDAVGAQPGMQKQKGQEVLVVPEADALIDPYAVVVEFLDTHVARGAVLAPSWLLKFARFAFAVGCEEELVERKPFKRFLLGRVGDVPRVDCARFVVAVVAGEHEHRARVFMPRGYVGTRNVWEPTIHVQVESTHRTDQVNYLD